MIITIPWLKKHLKTSAKENEIIDRLTNIGLEVEGVKENSGEMGKFKIAKVLKAEKHPNADKLKVCDVTIGCLLYTSPSPRDQRGSRMPSSA